MHFRFRSLAALFLLMSLTSCSDEVSRVLVYVTADAEVSPALETVEVAVLRDGEARSGQRFEIVQEDDEAPPDRVALPLSFVLEADDPGSYAVTVSVVGLTASGSVQRDATLTFVPGEDRAAIVLLTGDCLDIACEDGLTCANGDCVGATSATVDLATARERVQQSDCGNGLVELTEGCDDGNADAADGCDACIIEEGYACTGGPSVCGPICGDGRRIDGEEGCDDGNLMPGDGCSADCTVEAGWGCDGETCLPVCGDGNVTGDEECDDGNDTAGDGCLSCVTEEGFICNESGCRPNCGDGAVVVTEECDDGNEDEGDGCDSACRLEPGFFCSVPGERCEPDCGDGNIIGDEECDDGNTMSGDGCSASCVSEPGWYCDSGPCVTRCGDGVVAGEEVCDEGTAGNPMFPGCDRMCTVIVFGFTCDVPGEACRGTCGDGVLIPPEECDDGNAIAGDGCTDTCALEDGWHCPGAGGMACSFCSDGVTGGRETCDDGNLTPGDGCDAMCSIEPDSRCPEAGGECSVCGDGVVGFGEECEVGGFVMEDTCMNCLITLSCLPDAACCGDGVIGDGEACDDRNVSAGDGCFGCAVEVGYRCIGEPSICTM